MRTVPALLLLAFSLLGYPARADYPFSFQYSAETDLPYGPDALEVADVLRPRQGVRPAVLYIHGGAWMGNDKSQYEYTAEKYADAGFAVVNINYRLADPNHPESFAPWPAQLEDVQLAVRWMRAHAEEYNIDPNKICAVGDSAGAHLALFLGSMAKSHPGDRSQLFAKESPLVQCVVSMWGPADLTNPVEAKLLGTPPFLGKSLEEAPALWHEASPYFLIQSGSAPTFILQGLQDVIVPPAEGEELNQRLAEKGVLHVYWPVPGNHEFVNTPKEFKDDAEGRAVGFVSQVLEAN
jgi:acetyl esterase/lipase